MLSITVAARLAEDKTTTIDAAMASKTRVVMRCDRINSRDVM